MAIHYEIDTRLDEHVEVLEAAQEAYDYLIQYANPTGMDTSELALVYNRIADLILTDPGKAVEFWMNLDTCVRDAMPSNVLVYLDEIDIIKLNICL